MWSNQYIKIPFVDKGRTKEGSDCWGLVRIVYQEQLGIELPELSGYCDTRDRTEIAKIINSECSIWQSIQQGYEKPFDVVVFSFLKSPWHVGLVVKRGLVLHCQRASGTVHMDYINDKDWNKRIKGFYRHVERTDSPSTV